jgi:transposase-like protein
LAQGVSVEEIGRRFAKTPATVSYWLKKFSLEAPNREKYAAKGGIERARLQEFVDGGMTIREIAAALELSAGTVRYWLRRHGLRTLGRRGRRQGDVATRDQRERRCVVPGHSACRGEECVLLCANCHAEVEDGVASLPLQFFPQPEAAIHHNPG